jgi:hypothetical protein
VTPRVKIQDTKYLGSGCRNRDRGTDGDIFCPSIDLLPFEERDGRRRRMSSRNIDDDAGGGAGGRDRGGSAPARSAPEGGSDRHHPPIREPRQLVSGPPPSYQLKDNNAIEEKEEEEDDEYDDVFVGDDDDEMEEIFARHRRFYDDYQYSLARCDPNSCTYDVMSAAIELSRDAGTNLRFWNLQVDLRRSTQRRFINIDDDDDMDDDNDYDADDGMDRPFWFHQLVAALDRHPRIRCLRLGHGNLTDVAGDEDEDRGDDHDHDDDDGGGRARGGAADAHWNGRRPHPDDLAHLFRALLPRHPTLRDVSLCDCRIDARYLRGFADALLRNAAIAPNAAEAPPRGGRGGARQWRRRRHNNSTGKRLYLCRTPLDDAGAAAIADMLREHAPVNELTVKHCSGGGGSAGTSSTASRWRLLAHSASTNGHLRKLELHEDSVTVVPGLLEPLVGSASALRHLVVRADKWTDEAMIALLEALKTNTVLQTLELGGKRDDFRHVPIVEELLMSHNCTLTKIVVKFRNRPRGRHRLGGLLRRNRHIRKLVEVLETRDGALPRRALWPYALHFLGNSFPHLAYRFLRHGNVVVVAAGEEDEGSASISSSMLTKKRRRRRKRRLDRDRDGAASADEDGAATQE